MRDCQNCETRMWKGREKEERECALWIHLKAGDGVVVVVVVVVYTLWLLLLLMVLLNGPIGCGLCSRAMRKRESCEDDEEEFILYCCSVWRCVCSAASTGLLFLVFCRRFLLGFCFVWWILCVCVFVCVVAYHHHHHQLSVMAHHISIRSPSLYMSEVGDSSWLR